jgi:hypothetical protein
LALRTRAIDAVVQPVADMINFMGSGGSLFNAVLIA